ncbi:TorD/DmsD family molecular chaperone [Raoultibacter phocaeensis]|uniref:TorD/DmsD family molecular chaperone n=1 Tax=Raoultibacter phocaeensis TaxID=2479841 RepID=UPI00111A2BBB|nr:molecular chaperone TorD family protein [Raoultibacter phocaeensis]
MDEAIDVLLCNRSFLYSYLSRAFAAEPDEAFLEIVRNGHAQEACALLGGECESLHRALVSTISRSFDIGEIQSEYARLFVGPAKLPAPPWESVYATGEPLLFQESTLAVREAYQSAGFQAAGYPHEADDHLATELSFMAALAKKTSFAYATSEYVRLHELLAAQIDFLEHHIQVWFRPFAERLKGQDSSGFYPSFAALGALVCECDNAVLREIRSFV